MPSGSSRIFFTATMAFLIAVFSPPDAPAQADKAGMGSLEGRVICAEGNPPARFAAVRLWPVNKFGDPTTGYVDARTDLDGAYSFASIPAGDYIAQATLSGYSDDAELIMDTAYDMSPEERKTALGMLTQVHIKPGGPSHLDLTLHRGGAISGQVSFDTGGALNDSEVKATLLSSRFLDRIAPATARASHGSILERFAHSDDRGVYRFAGLPEGRYRIEVRVFYRSDPQAAKALQRPAAELKVYSPDSLSSKDAKLVNLDYGDEISGVDVTIPMSHLHSVSGLVRQGGTPLEGASVEIRSQNEKFDPKESHWSAGTLGDGSYRIDLVPAGSYVITAKFGAQPGKSTGVRRSIHVLVTDTDLSDANLDLPRSAQ